ncbi:MAG: hypothetical protein ACHQJ6_00060 [Candidatus Berkiellales bacterium]
MALTFGFDSAKSSSDHVDESDHQDTQTQVLDFHVSTMSCEDCVARMLRFLGEDAVTHNAIVRYDADINGKRLSFEVRSGTQPEDIVRVIKTAGHSADLGVVDHEDTKDTRERKRKRIGQQ